jgi:UDP-N-acetylmuramyl tripeptide synthase
VVNRIAPGFLAHTLGTFPGGLVVVTGSSGKSTTTKMLVDVLRGHGRAVFTNPSTANISQGITSALLDRVSLSGQIDSDIAVLEMDEAHGARMAPSISPSVVVLTNVMTDQIDRFYDSEQVAELLRTIALRASGAVVFNADDALVAGLVAESVADATPVPFGMSDASFSKLRHGLGYARTSPKRISSGTIVVSVDGATATIEHAGDTVAVTLPARGAHYATDAAAAIAAAASILGDHFDLSLAAQRISAMPPVFGRGEVATVRSQPVEFVLVQNPASFQLNVDELAPDLDQVLVAFGSDVRDPSYLWPVDVSGMPAVAIASGSKAYEVALLLEYQGVRVGSVEVDLGVALDAFLANPAPLHGVKTIVMSADSMRRTRTHLGLV